MYKITKLNESILDSQGNPIIEPKAKEKDTDAVVKIDNSKPRVLYVEALGQLAGNPSQQKSASGQEKIASYELAVKLRECQDDEVQLSNEQYNVLKKAIEYIDYYAYIYAQIMALIVEVTEETKAEEAPKEEAPVEVAAAVEAPAEEPKPTK